MKPISYLFYAIVYFIWKLLLETLVRTSSNKFLSITLSSKLLIIVIILPVSLSRPSGLTFGKIEFSALFIASIILSSISIAA